MKRLSIAVSVLLGATAMTQPALAESAKQKFNLNLENVTKQEVTSVSKKEEKAFEASSAIYVITQEDIQRSTATVVPELLRGVPGVQVSRVDSNVWSIGIRGFAEQFNSSLLVLIDGRTVYSPLFSGVYWGNQFTMLEDIDRIEIIRGPGSTLFGANAVNGVINIITKDAKFTQGNYASAGYGNEEGLVEGRHGGKVGESTYYRAYAMHQAFEATEKASTGDSAMDDWRHSQAGFRVDFEPEGTGRKITVQGDANYQNRGYDYTIPSLARTSPAITTNPFFAPGTYSYSSTQDNEDDYAFNVLSRWTEVYDDGSESQLQAFVDHTFRENFSLEQEITTLDIEGQYAWESGNHSFVAGAGYRSIIFDFDNTEVIFFDDTKSVEHVASAFIQDKFALIPDELYLTVGSKFEKNSYTGFEIQPNARLSYLYDENNTFWGAVTRAVRTPAKAENEIFLVDSITALPTQVAPGVFPLAYAGLVGSTQLQSEELTAFEIGYRTSVIKDVVIDATAFYNDYEDIITAGLAGVRFVNGGTPFVTFLGDNNADAESYGFEVDTRWLVKPWWIINANFSYFHLDIDQKSNPTPQAPITFEESSPNYMASIGHSFDLPNDITFDTNLHYMDNTSGANAYFFMDARVAWQPVDSLELSLAGTNLLEGQHPEAESALYVGSSEIERAVYARLKYYF